MVHLDVKVFVEDVEDVGTDSDTADAHFEIDGVVQIAVAVTLTAVSQRQLSSQQHGPSR